METRTPNNPFSSSLNSMVSSFTRSTSRGTSKRVRSSWTDQHITVTMDMGVSRRRCLHCTIAWSSNTSTGTIAKHLLDKHQTTTISQPCGSNTVIQPPLETSNLLISRAYEKKIDSSVTKYLISEILPHVHVECSGFNSS